MPCSLWFCLVEFFPWQWRLQSRLSAIRRKSHFQKSSKVLQADGDRGNVVVLFEAGIFTAGRIVLLQQAEVVADGLQTATAVEGDQVFPCQKLRRRSTHCFLIELKYCSTMSAASSAVST